MHCYRIEADGIVVSVRLTPRAARDALEGVKTAADGRAHLAARVRAVPEAGAANRALIELLARALRVPKSAVQVVAGAGARMKQVKIAGDPAALAQTMAAWERPA